MAGVPLHVLARLAYFLRLLTMKERLAVSTKNARIMLRPFMDTNTLILEFESIVGTLRTRGTRVYPDAFQQSDAAP
jgi:hypothetical protein